MSRSVVFRVSNHHDRESFRSRCLASWSLSIVQVDEEAQVVGDGLTVTNVTCVQKAIDVTSFNTLLLKANQIGSVTEPMYAVKLCKQNGSGVMCFHRSGETEDVTLADCSVRLPLPQFQIGTSCDLRRLAKSATCAV